MPWPQIYTPLGPLWLSALVAALPVIVLLGLLGFLRARAHWAALAGLATALAIALFVYHMPMPLALAAAGYGAAYGLFPIGWIVLAAIFVYDITVETGKFTVVRRTIAHLANDRRIQTLLIAFSFGAFIEGAAGFGTPVAICAAMLIGLGFQPLAAAGLALIGNTAPVAYGALGTPILALAGVTGLPVQDLSAMVGRQLPFFSLLVPFWLIWAMAGWRGMKEVWPACLVAGVTFAIPQFLVSNFYGPTLVDIVSALVSIFGLILLLRFWQPATIWRFPGEAENDDPPGDPSAVLTADRFVNWAEAPRGPVAYPAGRDGSDLAAGTATVTRREAFRAWMPWLILSLLVFLWGLPQFKQFLNNISILTIQVPYLDKSVLRGPPVVLAPRAEDAIGRSPRSATTDDVSA